MSQLPPKTQRRSIRVKGKLTQCWRLCPYSAAAEDDLRIPTGEKAVHTTTSGRMTFDIRGGTVGQGWVCLDDNCPAYLGTAVTPIDITVRDFTISGGQMIDTSYTVQQSLCSGTRFWES